MSDLAGHHILALTNTEQSRQEFIDRLQAAGCTVNLDSNEWQRVGDFSVTPPGDPARTAAAPVSHEPFLDLTFKSGKSVLEVIKPQLTVTESEFVDAALADYRDLFGYIKPQLTGFDRISASDADQFNTKLTEYFDSMSRYLSRCYAIERKIATQVLLNVQIENSGSAPARLATATLVFPSGFRCFALEEHRNWPQAPRPPKRPGILLARPSMPHLHGGALADGGNRPARPSVLVSSERDVVTVSSDELVQFTRHEAAFYLETCDAEIGAHTICVEIVSASLSQKLAGELTIKLVDNGDAGPDYTLEALVRRHEHETRDILRRIDSEED